MATKPKSEKRGWLSWLWPGSKLKARPARTRTHGFLAGYSDGLAASKRDRLTDDWSPASLSPNTLHRNDGAMLLRRARDLVENNPYAKSGVEAYVANVVGCGITPKPLLESPDARKLWVEGWNEWAGEVEPQADLAGQQHLYELMALWLTEIIVGGGCMVRYADLHPDEYRHQRVKLALDLIPEERFADEKDDVVAFQQRKKSGNPIYRGIEFAAGTGRAVAFWIRPTHPSEGGNFDAVRIDARQCRYTFFKTRIGQVRGFSMLKAVVMWLFKLGFYVDNELMASAIKSCFAAAISTDSEDAEFEGLDDDSQGAICTDVNGNPLEKLEPGIIARLRGKNSKISGIGPNVPTSETEAWIILIERVISIGMGLSYEAMTRDYSRGSFSSMRAGLNEDRKRYRPMQQAVVYHFCGPLYPRFNAAASLAGLDGFPRPSTLVANPIKVRSRTPGWQSVNPFDDARAAVLEIDNGLSTRESYTSAKGDDWEEIDEQAGREAESERRHELNYGKPGSVDPAQPGEAQQAAQSQQEARRAA